MKLIKVRLHEVTELEPHILLSLRSLEEGLMVLDNQINLGEPGRPDILAVDSAGTLVIIELKSDTASVVALDQVIRYFEWAAENLALLARPFPSVSHDRQPRIFLIAPDFDEGVKRLARYIDLDLTLISAICVKDTETGKIGVLLEPVDIPWGSSAPPVLRSVQDIVSYIADESVREEFERVLEEMRNAGAIIEPYNGGKDLGLLAKFESEAVSYIQARRRYFNWELYDDEGNPIYPLLKLHSYNEWTQKAKPDFLKWLRMAQDEA